ncbi:MAG: DUF4065 domain-containing protein [Dehalococcoidia bacterium]|nr:DUF4065 domain-containing protein [Dehalococcoidia bacterium]
MRFVYDQRKTAQAAAFLIRLAGGSLNYMVLIKLLYLADRESLIDTGIPITGDRMVAMPHGPVLSGILDEIHLGDGSGRTSVWYEYITEPVAHSVSLRKDAESDELSDYEMEVLSRSFEKFGHMNRWQLVAFTHKLPEWADPNGSSRPIAPEDILRSVGKSDDEIEALTQEAEAVWFVRTP